MTPSQKITPTRVFETLSPYVDREGGAPTGWAESIAEFLAHLLEHNQRVNLVSRKATETLLEDQVLPSLAALRLFPPSLEGRGLDIGSGGGFPAIPLKILRPNIRLDLIEATRKKTDFLESAVERLSLSEVRVHWGRIEAPPVELADADPFPLAIARAVGNHEKIARAASRLLGPCGALWIFTRGDDPDAELVWKDLAGHPITALRNTAPRP